jgi:hypothetical protein
MPPQTPPPFGPMGRPPQQPQKPGFYSHVMSGLLKTRSILNLLITDLLRFILVLFLFALIAGGSIAIFSYKQWYPTVKSAVYEFAGFSAKDQQAVSSSTASH